MVDPESARFWASWQDEDSEDLVLEDAELKGAEAAIEWGRARSRSVFIRLGNRGDTYFSASDEEVLADEGEPIPSWPAEGPPIGGWWDPKSGHTDLIELGE